MPVRVSAHGHHDFGRVERKNSDQRLCRYEAYRQQLFGQSLRVLMFLLEMALYHVIMQRSVDLSLGRYRRLTHIVSKILTGKAGLMMEVDGS